MKKGLQRFASAPLPSLSSFLTRWFASSAKVQPHVEERVLPAKEPLITCKRKELNHYAGQTYKQFQVIPLASKGWHHNKSRGDFFTINPVGETPAVSEVTSDVTFESLNIPRNIQNVLREQGILQPTAIQEQGIKEVLSGRHTLLAAETGSGKTLTYLLPLLQRISLLQSQVVRDNLNSPLAIVITPSRELAQQIGAVAEGLCDTLGLGLKVICGGHTKRLIMNPSFDTVDILVATLGALKKLTSTGVYRTQFVRHIVLDEADTLLDDSFNDMLLHFLKKFQFESALPSFEAQHQHQQQQPVQLILVSATIPTSIAELLGGLISLDDFCRVTTKNLHRVQIHVPQKFLRLSRSQKPAQLLKIVSGDFRKKHPVLIFSNQSSTSDWISLFLNENGVPCSNLNGDMPYEIRLGKFHEFQSGKCNVLSCTDIGSRGLDTVKVKHVINYEFPVYIADYIHRCGRVGRVGSASGCHVTNFIGGYSDVELVQKIEQAVRLGEPLPNVNANITKIIKYKILKSAS